MHCRLHQTPYPGLSLTKPFLLLWKNYFHAFVGLIQAYFLCCGQSRPLRHIPHMTYLTNHLKEAL